LSPHAFTCSVCDPEPAPTDVSIVVAFTIVVSELLSNEYPIALTFCDEQETAMADRVNGDDTELLLTGVLTVTPAKAGRANATTSDTMSVSFRAAFMEILNK